MAETKNITTIGSKEYIDLPDQELFRVPAKIDTGAYGSAIWASNVKVVDGRLTFSLFGKRSPWYTGKVISTRDFSAIRVKSSFGVSELRYRTTLKIRLAERVLKVSFTLANRENQRTPILIGRRTIKGRYMVDVSIRTPSKPARMLMLSALVTRTVTKFAEGVEAAASGTIRITYSDYADLCFK